MKKVTIEITENGYKTVYTNGDMEITEEWERTSTGARVISENDFDSLTEDQASDKMWEALQDLKPYDVMRALEEEGLNEL